VGPSVIVLGSLTMGLAEVVLGLSRWYPLSLAMMLVAGLGGIAMAATANTTIQLSVPDELRGRVMSVYTTAFAGSVPLGGLVAGAVASGFGADVAMGLGGAATAAVAIGGIAWLRRIQGG
jgi:glycerol-3-phosphate dehydrogenase